METLEAGGPHQALAIVTGELHPGPDLRLVGVGHQPRREGDDGAPGVLHDYLHGVALVVGGVAGVEAAVGGLGVVDAEPVLEGGVPHGLLCPALQHIQFPGVMLTIQM